MTWFRIPEPYVLLCSFVLNLVWEFLHTPFFVFDQQATPYSLTGCLLFCSGIDSIMTLTAFWVASVFERNRFWFLDMRARQLLLFVGTGLLLALVSEYTAVHYRNIWDYSSWMPVLPALNIGLTPFLQWLLLPFAVLIPLRRRFR